MDNENEIMNDNENLNNNESKVKKKTSILISELGLDRVMSNNSENIQTINSPIMSPKSIKLNIEFDSNDINTDDIEQIDDNILINDDNVLNSKDQ